MKILHIAHFLPYPPHGGAIQRNYNLLKQLSKRHEIHGLVFNQSALIPEATLLAEGSAHCRNAFYTELSLFKIPTDGHSLAWYTLLSTNVLSPVPYSVWRYRSKVMTETILSACKQQNFDVAYIDTIALAPYAKACGDIPCVLGHHNIESSLLLRRAETEKRSLAAAYFRYQGQKLRRYEALIASDFAAHTVVSELDAQDLKQRVRDTPIHVVENGTDTNYFTPRPANQQLRVIFAGGMTWYPNADAMLFFCHEIFPLLQKLSPEVEFHIIGSKPPLELRELAAKNPQIKILGYVDDVRDHIASAAVYVVPIRVGGGTRLKVLDAMAQGKAIVSTTVGAEGIDARPGYDLEVADSPEAIAKAIAELLHNPARRIALGAQARKTVEQLYAWEVIAPKLERAFEQAVGRNNS